MPVEEEGGADEGLVSGCTPSSIHDWPLTHIVFSVCTCSAGAGDGYFGVAGPWMPVEEEGGAEEGLESG